MIRLGIAALWLCMLLALLRYEAYPEWFTQSLQGYRGLVARELLLRDNWSRILIGGIPAGYGHTSIGVDDTASDNSVDIENRTYLRATVLGRLQNFSVRSKLRLDPMFNLSWFEMRVTTRDHTIDIQGERMPDSEDQFALVARIGEQEQRSVIRIPADTILYAPMTEMAMRNMRPGQQLTVKTLDPLTLSEARIILRARGREAIEVAGVVHEATRIEASYRNLTLTSWVGRDGQVLRQETPLGWVIEACSSDQALAAVADDAPVPELLGAGGGAGLLQLLNAMMGGAHD